MAVQFSKLKWGRKNFNRNQIVAETGLSQGRDKCFDNIFSVYSALIDKANLEEIMTFGLGNNPSSFFPIKKLPSNFFTGEL